MVVHAGRCQQARNRRPIAIRAAVGEDDDRVAGGDRVARALLQGIHRGRQTPCALLCVVEHRQRDRLERRLVHVTQLRELIVVDDRVLDFDLPARLGPRLEQVASGPIVDPIVVTSSSRMASSGGFVTCAKSCLK
jgi:hypothetical protein